MSFHALACLETLLNKLEKIDLIHYYMGIAFYGNI